MKNPFSAILLAGGRSSRMGVDKAHLRYNDKPLWLHQIEKFKKIGADEIFISRGVGQQAWDCEQLFVWDRFNQAGPMGGIIAGMEASKNPFLIVLAVDLPLISVDVLIQLRQRIINGMGAVYRSDSFFEPLVAAYSITLRREMVDSIEKGERSMQGLLNRWVENKQIDSIPVPRELIVQWTNVNTVSELQGLEGFQ